MKYSSTDRPSRKFDLIGRGMISPFGLATRPRMAGDLADLHHVSAGTRVDHHVDRVRLVEGRLHRLGDLVGGLRPDLDELLTTLVVGDQTALELLLDLGGLLLEDLAGSRPCVGGVTTSSMETVTPERVAQWKPASLRASSARGDLDLGVALGEVVDDHAELLLADLVVRRRRSPPAAPR